MRDFDVLFAAYAKLVEEGKELKNYLDLWEGVCNTAKGIRLRFEAKHKDLGIHVLSKRYHQVVGSTPLNEERTSSFRQKIIASGLSEQQLDVIIAEINRAVEQEVGKLFEADPRLRPRYSQ